MNIVADTQLDFRKVGERMRKARKRAHLSQEAAAVKLDTTQQMISEYETGETEAGMHVIEAMARIYDATSDFLLLLVDEPTQKYPVPNQAELLDKLAAAIAKNNFGEASEIIARLVQKKN